MEIPAYLRVKFGEEVWNDETEEGKERDFFDRLEARQKSLDILRSLGTRRAIWLLGERRAGKTSLLKLLLSKCQKEGAIAIEVPWQSIRSSTDFYKEFLYRLDKKSNALQGAGDDSAAPFWQALEQFLQAKGWPWLVVGVDELDGILLEQVDDQAGREILGVLIRLVTEIPNTKVIVASSRPAYKIEQVRTSPLVSKSEEIPVIPFDTPDLQEMIQTLAPGLTQDEVEQITQRSGGWPYYAKAILYHLLQFPSDTPRRLERAYSQAVTSIHSTCDHLYRYHWDKSEKQALWLLVNKEKIKSDELERLDATVRSAFQGLVQRGYLLKENGYYRFRVMLIADWLKGWTRREVEEQDLAISSLLKKMSNPWTSEAGEQTIRVSREELRKRGF